MRDKKIAQDLLVDQALLEVWAAQYQGLNPDLVYSAQTLLSAIAPGWLTPVDYTLLGRWLAIRGWLLNHTINHMAQPADRAFIFWRGLRSVAESRAAPTTLFGAAISDVVGNLSHLRQVHATDILLVGVGIGDWVDGLAALYQWQVTRVVPSLPNYLSVAPNLFSVLPLYALLSATHSWGLAELFPSSNVRRLISLVSLALSLIEDLYGSPRTVISALQIAQDSAGTEEPARAHIQALLDDLLKDIERELALLDQRWQELADWTRVLLSGWQVWATSQVTGEGA